MKIFYKYPLLTGVGMVMVEWYAITFLLIPYLLTPNFRYSVDGRMLILAFAVLGVAMVPVLGAAFGVLIEREARNRGIK